ncbi:phage shock protein PspA [Panacagrimonas sp.]|uniref:phage shock protein PspA n=1 Tax=Panacagrimonas sp. TaxID=2480088 RepID=UPI003B52C2E0
MGIFSRLSDVINSNLHAMLDKAEDPEKMIRLIIQEMEDTLVEVRSSSVRSLARKKEVQRALQSLNREATDWQAKAELAITKDREDLARGALGARNRAQEQVAGLEKELAHLDEDIARLDVDTGRLKAKLDDARARQKVIVLRQQSLSSRLRVQGQLDDRRMQDAVLRMERYEGRIDRMEAELESYDLGRHALHDEFNRMQTEDQLEAEIAELRARLGKLREQPPAPAPERS